MYTSEYFWKRNRTPFFYTSCMWLPAYLLPFIYLILMRGYHPDLVLVLMAITQVNVIEDIDWLELIKLSDKANLTLTFIEFRRF